MEYKKVKNSNKPGRPPSGCVWVKNEEGNLVTNSKGEVAYRPATAADQKKKKAVIGKKRGPKGKRGRKAAPVLDEEQKQALLLKKTYKDLSSKELEKVQGIVESLVDAAKDAEKRALENAINKLQTKLEKLD
jgi:hypothetical protein